MNRRNRIFTGTSAGLIAQSALGLTQLASIPIFFAVWGPEKYGIWLMLSTLPAYLALSDFGIISTTTTQMTIFFGAGKPKEAIKLFLDLQKLFRVISLALLAISATFLLIAFYNPSKFDIFGTLAILVLSVAASQFQGLTFGALRASGKFSAAILIGMVVQVTEWSGLIIALLNRGGMLEVASTSLVFKIIAVASSAIWSRKLIGDLSFQTRGGSIRDLGSNLASSLSALGLTLSNAVWIQGSTLVAGAALGPAAAAILSTYRTVTRLPLQLTASFSQSLWPEFSSLHGSGQTLELNRVYSRFRNFNMFIGMATTILWFGVCLALFPYLTSRNLTFEVGLGALFSVAALIGILSQAPRTLLLGTNRHLRLGYIYLIVSLLFLPILGMAGQFGGIYALIAALVAGELVNYVIAIRSLKGQNSIFYERRN
jgi:O-antigen/teichoic acid export membrane protein